MSKPDDLPTTPLVELEATIDDHTRVIGDHEKELKELHEKVKRLELLVDHAVRALGKVPSLADTYVAGNYDTQERDKLRTDFFAHMEQIARLLHPEIKHG